MYNTPDKGSCSPTKDRKPKSRLWRWLLRLGIATLVVLTLYSLFRPSPQTQLAAIDAANSIPDQENAAFVYARLLPESLRPSALADFTISRKDEVPSIYTAAGVKIPMIPGVYPWYDPAFKEYVRDHVESFNILRDASELKGCYFPIYRGSGEKTLRDVLLRVINETLMVWGMAAQVEFNEGRQSEALFMARVMIDIGRHLSQQPTIGYLQTGLRAEALGLRIRNRYMINGDASLSDLDDFRDSCGSLEDRWDSIRGPLERVDKMYCNIDRRNRSLKKRFFNTIEPFLDKNRYKSWIRELRYGSSDIQWVCQRYYRLLCERKGHRIIIELRRLKNQTGRWPDSLDPLKPMLAADDLIDPFSDKPFVYRLAGDAFALYGVGSNGRDDKGDSYYGSDDDPIWLPEWEDLYNPKRESQEDPNQEI